MEKQRETGAVQGKTRSGGNRALGVILGSALGYLVGRAFLDKPAVGVALGAALAFVIGSDGDDEG